MVSTSTIVDCLKIGDCKDFNWAYNSNAPDKGVWHALRQFRSLKLINIVELISLPEGLKCIATLEQLSLYRLTNLKALPEWITKLRRLTIHYCLKLTTFPNSNGSFLALQELEIQYCPIFSRFPQSFPNLKRLRVRENSRFEQILRTSPNLEELEIEQCVEQDWDTQNNEGVSSVGVLQGLKKLRSLKLSKLKSIPNILDFGKMSDLFRLVIQSCPKLTVLPESLCSLPALEHLHINSCPGLTHLPNAFTNLESLKQLEIRVSPQLEKRCRKPNGEDCHLIQHIPTLIC